jgi:hypothetical protein
MKKLILVLAVIFVMVAMNSCMMPYYGRNMRNNDRYYNNGNGRYYNNSMYDNGMNRNSGADYNRARKAGGGVVRSF